MPNPELKHDARPEYVEQAGPIGVGYAAALGAKCTEGIAGFPDASPEQRAAIAQLVVGELELYTTEEVGPDG